MTTLLDLKNYYTRRVLPLSNQIRLEIEDFSKSKPKGIQEVYSKVHTLNQLFGDLKKSIEVADSDILALRSNPLDEATRQEVVLLDHALHSNLNLQGRINAVFMQFLLSFDRAKEGKLVRDITLVHPRSLYPTHFSNGDAPLRFIPENSIEHFPIGLVNRGNNCWANAMLQLLMNIPSLRTNFLNRLPEEKYRGLKEIVSTYLKNQQANETHPGSKVVSDANSQQVRMILSRCFEGMISPRATQEDASAALLLLLGELEATSNPLFTETTTIRQYDIPDRHPLHFLIGTPSCPELDYRGLSINTTPEAMTFIPLLGNIHLPFTDLIDCAFNTYGGEPGKYCGISVPLLRECRVFKTLPKQLTFCASRLVGREKINAPVLFPEQYVLPPEYTETNQRGHYQLKGFISHGGGAYGGHYFSFIRLDNGTWVECNDRRITILSPERLRRELNSTYVTYYEFVEEVDEDRAEEIIESYPKEAPLRITPPSSTESGDVDRTKIDLVRAFEEALASDDDSRIKAAFAAIPEDVKQTFYHVKWVHDLFPTDEDYGHNAVETDPKTLKEIHTPWLIPDSENIVTQLLALLEKEGDRSCALFQLKALKILLDDPTITNDQMHFSLEKLPDHARLTFLNTIATINGHPIRDKVKSLRVLKENVRILSTCIRPLIEENGGPLIDQLIHKYESERV